MKTIVTLLSILCLPLSAFAADKTIKGEIRDPSGKLLYKTYSGG
jgi:hypothetical protein